MTRPSSCSVSPCATPSIRPFPPQFTENTNERNGRRNSMSWGGRSWDLNEQWRAFDLDLRCEEGGGLHCFEVFGRQLLCASRGLHPQAVPSSQTPRTPSFPSASAEMRRKPCRQELVATAISAPAETKLQRPTCSENECLKRCPNSESSRKKHGHRQQLIVRCQPPSCGQHGGPVECPSATSSVALLLCRKNWQTEDGVIRNILISSASHPLKRRAPAFQLVTATQWHRRARQSSLLSSSILRVAYRWTPD